MEKLWICGSNGQIGKALNKVLDPLKYEVFNTDMDEVDVTDVKEVMRFADVSPADVIINCAGYTRNRECESDPVRAYKVNAMGARNLSIAANKIGAKIVQISTDDVFSGDEEEPYTEFDVTEPISVYGKSKLAGENFVKEFTSKHFIIRSTWIYGDGDNFVTNFLKSVDNGESLAVPADQYGSPTSADELARFILHIMDTNEYGTYHATCKGVCSRYQFADEILALYGKNRRIKAVTSADVDAGMLHPAYTVLDNFVIKILGSYDFPNWKDALAEYMKGRG